MSDYDESDSDEERADGSLPSFTEFGARGMFELYQVCPPPSPTPPSSPPSRFRKSIFASLFHRISPYYSSIVLQCTLMADLPVVCTKSHQMFKVEF